MSAVLHSRRLVFPRLPLVATFFLAAALTFAAALPASSPSTSELAQPEPQRLPAGRDTGLLPVESGSFPEAWCAQLERAALEVLQGLGHCPL